MTPGYAKYLRTRAVAGPWVVEGCDRKGFSGAVVIPALGEEQTLPDTLHSLAHNPSQWLERFLILVVVNNRDASTEIRAQNRRTLEWLSADCSELSGLCLAWVDASSTGRELPEGEGVGLARKIGFDLALPRLDWTEGPVLAALDADTLVRPDYLETLSKHFRSASEGAAVIPFCHRRSPDPAQDEAMSRYELYLRHYVFGLELAASPYAFHTVGSAMACRASAYIAAGGMNRRQAGEDFYFLQQMAKTCGVAQLHGTVVFPSPRLSCRTPFGTGPSLRRLIAGESDAVRFYPWSAFETLRCWLLLIGNNWQDEGARLVERAGQVSSALKSYLIEVQFAPLWERLRRQHSSGGRLLQAFHQWFDGLRTRQLLYRICERDELWGPPETHLPSLLRRGGLQNGGNIGTYLAILRSRQTGEACPREPVLRQWRSRSSQY